MFNENNEQQKEYLNSKCPNCGSELKFLPGSSQTKCISCGSTFDIQSLGKGKLDEEEIDLAPVLEKYKEQKREKIIQKTIHCQDCGGLIILNDHSLSLTCPFCGSHRVVLQDDENDFVKIAGVVPFVVNEDFVKKEFQKWIKGRFFVPSKIKKGIIIPSYAAFYIPFYTFDADTVSPYSAYRGDYYYTTRVIRDGKTTRTVTERHTRWTPVKGTIYNDFDDVLVNGTNNTLVNYIGKITNFDFEKMEKFQEQFLLGYYSELPSLPLDQAFDHAKQDMMSCIKRLCIADIGGDTYSNLKFKTTFSDVTFKQIMVPIYNGSYSFKNKKYCFVVNGQTGKFAGNYPISAVKISILILGILAIIAMIFLLIYLYERGDVYIVKGVIRQWNHFMNLI